MSVKVSGEVWQHSRGLKAGAKLLMLALADWCNDDYVCWPKIPAIALKCDCDEKTASRIVHELEMDGFLEVKRGGGRGRGNEYELYPRGDRFTKPRKDKTPQLAGEKPKPPQIKGDNIDQTPANKGGLNSPAYKVEPSVNKVLTVSGGGGTCAQGEGAVQETPPPPQASEPKQTRDSIAPIRLALCEVCGLSPDTLSRRDERELARIEPWLLGEMAGDEMAVATGIRQRYSRPIWSYPTPPHLSQIKPDTWARYGRAIELQSQTNEVNNEPTSRNSPFGNGRTGNRAFDEQMELLRDLGHI